MFFKFFFIVLSLGDKFEKLAAEAKDNSTYARTKKNLQDPSARKVAIEEEWSSADSKDIHVAGSRVKQNSEEEEDESKTSGGAKRIRHGDVNPEPEQPEQSRTRSRTSRTPSLARSRAPRIRSRSRRSSRRREDKRKEEGRINGE